ncbi:MAG: hypothetical protein AB1449_12030 [Chloroflexota bacterium]
MTARAGNALVLIGLIALVVFLIMFTAGTSDLLLLLGGAAISALGLTLRRRAARLVQRRVRRFRALRRLMGERPPEDEETLEHP